MKPVRRCILAHRVTRSPWCPCYTLTSRKQSSIPVHGHSRHIPENPPQCNVTVRFGILVSQHSSRKARAMSYEFQCVSGAGSDRVSVVRSVYTVSLVQMVVDRGEKTLPSFRNGDARCSAATSNAISKYNTSVDRIFRSYSMCKLCEYCQSVSYTARLSIGTSCGAKSLVNSFVVF